MVNTRVDYVWKMLFHGLFVNFCCLLSCFGSHMCKVICFFVHEFLINVCEQIF